MLIIIASCKNDKFAQKVAASLPGTLVLPRESDFLKSGHIEWDHVDLVVNLIGEESSYNVNKGRVVDVVDLVEICVDQKGLQLTTENIIKTIKELHKTHVSQVLGAYSAFLENIGSNEMHAC